jgi:hypothetical protein
MDIVLAYIDPGAGSLLVQALIAGMVAIPIFFRKQIGRGVRAVRRMTGRPSEPAHGRDDVAPPT